MSGDTTRPTLTSWTLTQSGILPETACASCPNAIWQKTNKDEIRVWCKLMFAMVDVQLTSCDGNPPQPEPEETMGEPLEASDLSATSPLDQLDLDDLPDPNLGPEDY